MRWPTLLARLLDKVSPRAVSLGQRGELEAARYLRSKGYKIIAGGFRQRYGEIDLIAVYERTIVFVEVKTRGTPRGGLPAEAVDRQKQQRIVRTALNYLKRHRLLECRVRFDIIGIVWPAGSVPELTHYADAFQPPSSGATFGQFYS